MGARRCGGRLASAHTSGSETAIDIERSSTTVALALSDAAVRLPDDGRLEAECLLAHVLGRERVWLYTHANDPLPMDALQTFHGLVARRMTGEPVAYLVERRGFWTFDLRVTPDTLIPRPETERLVELALERLPDETGLRVADMGTGSGAIALALAYERPRADVIATDVSAAALEIAATNAQMLGLRNVRFCEGAWWEPLAGERFDLIASNPPYIDADDPHLEQGDLRYEPELALSPGHDGLAAIRVLIDGASSHLRAGGWMLLEHGWQQGEAVRGLMRQAGLMSVQTACDLEGRERVTLGRTAT